MKKYFTTPRIIAILLLIIAGIAYFAQTNGSTILGIMGIILLIAPTKHSQQKLDQLIKTITNWKTIIITSLYDALFWLVAAGSASFYMWKLQTNIEKTQTGMAFTKQGMINPTTAGPMADAIQSIMGFLIWGMIIVLLLSFIAYYISRTAIWTTITKQKVNKKFLLKYFGINACWWLLWLIPLSFFIIVSTKTPQARTLVIGVFFIAAYFTGILHPLFMRTHKIGYSFGNALGWGISKVHKLIVPYTYAFIIYIIIYQPFKLIQNTMYVKPASMLLVVIFLAWLRTYIYETVKEFK